MDSWIIGLVVEAGARHPLIHHSNTPLLRSLVWSPRLVSRQRLLLFKEALICLSYSGKEKLQASTSKHPRNLKTKDPNFRYVRCTFDVWGLKILWCLELGRWSF